MSEGGVVCHREEEVQVQAVRVAEVVRRVVGVVRQVDGAVRLIVVRIAGHILVRTEAGVHQPFLTEGSGGISLQGFRRI